MFGLNASTLIGICVLVIFVFAAREMFAPSPPPSTDIGGSGPSSGTGGGPGTDQ